MSTLRTHVFTEPDLPDFAQLVAEGRADANSNCVQRCAFLAHHQVSSEHEYKQLHIHSGRVMRHAQIGYRSLSRSGRAYAEIYEKLNTRDCSPDRYGICLDWSMGYPVAERRNRSRGTGLILESEDAFRNLTELAPVAPHFGDFVLGMPAAYENTRAALAAGSTSIGNLGQYFTFRLPDWDDDVRTTAETVKAIALCAAQTVPILIHSNLDDGFAALFSDLACALGAVLIEQYIVDDLLQGNVSHCYGHTYSESLARFAFQRALAEVSTTPGTMIYGNTTLYGSESIPNYAGLSSYLLVDILAQRLTPTGHAVNPVPVSEAQRIPDIDEIVDAHLFANRMIERAEGFIPLLDTKPADQAASEIISGARRFKNNVLKNFEQGDIDIANPLELLLAIRRLGPRFLEQHYGPGEPDKSHPRGRKPIFLATTISELEQQAGRCVSALTANQKKCLAQAQLTLCVVTTDVHEYGKMLVESVLEKLEVSCVDGGVCSDPDDLVARVQAGGASAIAISTYNGVALDYLNRLNAVLGQTELGHLPIYIGGKLNQIVDLAGVGISDDANNDSMRDLPRDVSPQLRNAGAIPCHRLEDMLLHLVDNLPTESR